MLRRQMLATLSAVGLGPVLGACAEEVEAQGVNALQAQSGAPALAGAVVGVDGIKLIEFAGVRRQGEQPRVGPAELWHLGSNTKAMTAALYGRLVDQGKARWQATLGELFEGVRLDPGFARQSVEALMGHRSGMLDASVMGPGYLINAHDDVRPPPVQRADLTARILGKPPGGKVGTFAYSNLGYVVLGSAIERITGRSWEEAITAELFTPLGMARAGFGAPLGANAWGHRPALIFAGPLKGVDPAGTSDNPVALGPAGRAHANLTDYARFLRLFLTDGGDVLTPATVKTLTTPLPGEDTPYALGWGIMTPPWAKGPVLGHEGSNTMWHAVAIVSPAHRLAFVGVANGPRGATRSAARKFAVQLRKRFIPD